MEDNKIKTDEELFKKYFYIFFKGLSISAIIIFGSAYLLVFLSELIK